MSHPAKFLKSAEEEFLKLPRPVQDDIVEKIRILEEFPYSGKVMEKTYAGYRSFLAWHKQYRIIYRVLDDKIVEIAYLRHCRRQLSLRAVH